MPDWSAIHDYLANAGVLPADYGEPQRVDGGAVSDAWRVRTSSGDVFIKTGPTEAMEMYTAEAEGLQEISGTGAIRVPEVVTCGGSESCAFIALEWLEFDTVCGGADALFGEQFANLHRATSGRFGWHRDNTVGLTPQCNSWGDNWIEFFREKRLLFQFELARKNGFSGELQRRGTQVMDRLAGYFESYEPVPSLLHGDLWYGNYAFSNGMPVIFDPAVYYGDREADLAMTRLFGGFGDEFYLAYESSWALDDGSVLRQHLYQLYHVLNHLNFFGSEYLGRALQLMDLLLREKS